MSIDTSEKYNGQFVHFRTQSSYSMLESAIKIDDLTKLAKTNNMPAVAMCDRGNLFGSLEFALSAQKTQIQPIHGVILNIKHHRGDFVYDNSKHSQIDHYSEILVIAKDNQGFKNLLQLVSRSFTVNDRSNCEHVTLEDIKSLQAGLVILSAYDQGIVGHYLSQNDIKAAQASAKFFQEIFGNRFYFEIIRLSKDSKHPIESVYLKIASEYQIPLIATNQVLFKDEQMHKAHDILLCISQGVVRDQQDRKTVSKECYFKSVEQMRELFSDLPEAIENSWHLSRRCSVMASTRPPALPNFSSENASEDELLREEAKNGLKDRLTIKFAKDKISEKEQIVITQEYNERLDYELEIICKMQFPGYFLIVSDFIKWSKQNNIAVGPGRGSGAGSIIAWTLQITDLDPIAFGLLFERFLNPERVSMPDFDIDFCQERREEVIRYVRKKYGDSRVGQIITFGKMQAKAVIKDVSRVLGLPYIFADNLTELVPFNAVNPVSLSQAIEEVSELNNAFKGNGLYNLDGENDLIKQVLETALILEGLHRHASTHAAGIVIANNDIVETVPLYKDSLDSEMNVVQYSMKYAEMAGLVKFDFLGLQTLTVITKCCDLLKEQNINIDMGKIDFYDKPTFAMLAQGLSTGVFQFESGGMKSALKRLKPDCVEDLIALGALYRPGPMENIPTYIACKHKTQEPNYLHPKLAPILQETYGVIIYQEQVMEIAKLLSGYSLGAADLLRRAMGKKVKAEMDAQEEMFVSGAIANGVSANQAKSIFATVAKFAGYGFNKSHASAYGVISYQTAYLKANFPSEFLVASLNLDIDSSDKINIFLQEAQQLSIKILPPCINNSKALFSVEIDEQGNKNIRFAICAIKNVSKNLGRAAEDETTKSGPFKSVLNFLERISPKLLNKRLLENLIKAGCFDDMKENRASLLASIGKMLAYASSFETEQTSNQISLINVSHSKDNIIEQVEEMPDIEKAYGEFQVFGLFLTNHPLSHKQALIDRLSLKNRAHLYNDLVDGSHLVRTIGIIVKKDSRMSARGRFVTLLISDPSGIYEVTIFSDEILQKYAHLLKVGSEVVIDADIFIEEGNLRITARKFSSLNELISETEHNIKLRSGNVDDTQQIIGVLSKYQQNRQLNNSSTSPIGDKLEETKYSDSFVTILIENDRGFTATVKFDHSFKISLEDLTFLEKYSWK